VDIQLAAAVAKTHVALFVHLVQELVNFCDIWWCSIWWDLAEVPLLYLDLSTLTPMPSPTRLLSQPNLSQQTKDPGGLLTTLWACWSPRSNLLTAHNSPCYKHTLGPGIAQWISRISKIAIAIANLPTAEVLEAVLKNYRRPWLFVNPNTPGSARKFDSLRYLQSYRCQTCKKKFQNAKKNWSHRTAQDVKKRNSSGNPEKLAPKADPPTPCLVSNVHSQWWWKCALRLTNWSQTP